MKLFKNTLLSLLFMFVSCFSFVGVIQAAAYDWDQQTGVGAGTNPEIKQEFGGSQAANAQTLIARVIRIALSVLGIIFVILLIVAGFKYMLATGDEQTKEALVQIRNAIIGIVIVISAYGIAEFVMKALADTSG